MDQLYANIKTYGLYSINVAPGVTLLFTSTSYDSVEQVVDERNEYNISMKLKLKGGSGRVGANGR